MKRTSKRRGLQGAFLASLLVAACAQEGTKSRSAYTGAESRAPASETSPVPLPATASPETAPPEMVAPAGVHPSPVTAPTGRTDLVAGGAQSDPATAGTPGNGAEQSLEDATLTIEVKNRLSNDRDEEVRVLLVGVSNGIVTLGGTVKTEDQRTRASELIRNVDGVHSVVSRVTLIQSK